MAKKITTPQKQPEPMDDNPPIDHVHIMADMFNKANISVDNSIWLNDKSKDFYLGMYAAFRISISGVKNLKEQTEMTLDDLEFEFMVLNGQIANKIIEKHEKETTSQEEGR